MVEEVSKTKDNKEVEKDFSGFSLLDLDDEYISSLEVDKPKEAETTQDFSGFSLFDYVEKKGDDKFYQTKQPSGDLSQKRIDGDTGAPAYIRAIVGSVVKPQDKLETLKKYYPDAQQYGEDNFLFTDPETNNVTLYNPDKKALGFIPYPDVGDIASVTREAFISGGTAIGGAVGAALGAPTGGLASPALAYGGAATGAAVTASAFDALLEANGLTTDTRTVAEKTIQSAYEATAVLGGEVAGRAIAKGSKALLSGGQQTLKRTVDLFDRLGITPTLATTGGKRSANIQAGLSQNVFTSKSIEEISKKQLQQTHAAVNKVISKFGVGKTLQGAGEDIVTATKNVASRFKARQTEIYEEVFDEIGADFKVPVKNIISLRGEIQDQINQAPRTLTPMYNDIIGELDNIIADASDGGIGFGALRSIRTSIGKRMNTPSLIDSGALKQTQLDMLYANLTLDISEAAASVGDDVARKLTTADRYTRTFLNNSSKLLEKINKFDADEKVTKFLYNSGRDGGTALNKLRRNFEPEEWDVLAASTIKRLGSPLKDGEFSIGQFLNNYKKIAPEAKEALFGGKRYAGAKSALDDLMQALEKLGDVEKYANTSNTAGAGYTLSIFDAMGGGVGGVFASILGGADASVAGGLTGMALTGAGRYVAPKTAAKLITSEKFVRWLAEPVKDSTISIAEHIAKLYAIADADADLKEYLYEYAEALKENTGGLE